MTGLLIHSHKPFTSSRLFIDCHESTTVYEYISRACMHTCAQQRDTASPSSNILAASFRCAEPKISADITLDTNDFLSSSEPSASPNINCSFSTQNSIAATGCTHTYTHQVEDAHTQNTAVDVAVGLGQGDDMSLDMCVVLDLAPPGGLRDD